MHTTDTVMKALRRALDLAKRLAPDDPSGPRYPWLKITHDEAAGNIGTNSKVTGLTVAELNEYSETLAWLNFLKIEGDRKILLLYAAGLSVGDIARRCNAPASQVALSKRILWAAGFIAYKLNAGENPPAFDSMRQAPSPEATPMEPPWKYRAEPVDPAML